MDFFRSSSRNKYLVEEDGTSAKVAATAEGAEDASGDVLFSMPFAAANVDTGEDSVSEDEVERVAEKIFDASSSAEDEPLRALATSPATPIFRSLDEARWRTPLNDLAEQARFGNEVVWSGSYLWKLPFNSTGPPQMRWFQVVHDPKRAAEQRLPSSAAFLQWHDPKKSTAPRFVSLLSVLKITPDHKTNAFSTQIQKRGKTAVPPKDLSFSLITEKRTVDLAATDRGERERWIGGLQDVIAGLKKQNGDEAAAAATEGTATKKGTSMRAQQKQNLATFLRIGTEGSSALNLSAKASPAGEELIDSSDNARRHCVVSGAGTPEANGIYYLIESTIESRDTPRYENEHGVNMSRERIKKHWGWIIGKAPVAFYGKRTEELLPPKRGWKKYGGKTPVPVVKMSRGTHRPISPKTVSAVNDCSESSDRLHSSREVSLSEGGAYGRHQGGAYGTEMRMAMSNNRAFEDAQRMNGVHSSPAYWRRTLFEYCRRGQVELVRQVLDQGCDVDLMSAASGDTILLLSCRLGHEELVKLALDRKAKNDPHPEFGETALQTAISNGHRGCAAIILSMAKRHNADHIIVNHADSNKDAPLHKAVRNADVSCAELLLMHGANFSLVDAQGSTALHIACALGNIPCAALLLECGSDELLDVGDHDGNTPLHAAARSGNARLVKLLLETAADPRSINSRGESPYVIAKAVGARKCMELLGESEEGLAGTPRMAPLFTRCLLPGEGIPSGPVPMPKLSPDVNARMARLAYPSGSVTSRVASPHSSGTGTATDLFAGLRVNIPAGEAKTLHTHGSQTERAPALKYSLQGASTPSLTSGTTYLVNRTPNESTHNNEWVATPAAPSADISYASEYSEADEATESDTWEIHYTEEGHRYFYNATTGESQWEDPRDSAYKQPAHNAYDQSGWAAAESQHRHYISGNNQYYAQTGAEIQERHHPGYEQEPGYAHSSAQHAHGSNDGARFESAMNSGHSFLAAAATASSSNSYPHFEHSEQASEYHGRHEEHARFDGTEGQAHGGLIDYAGSATIPAHVISRSNAEIPKLNLQRLGSGHVATNSSATDSTAAAEEKQISNQVDQNQPRQQGPKTHYDSAKFVKYEKMKKMGLPDGAIKHKMAMESMSAEDIDLFFARNNGERNEGAAPVAAAETAEAKLEIRASSVTDDPKFEKYKKMRKMGLPDGAVRQRMMRDGMEEGTIAVFFGETPPEKKGTNMKDDPRFVKYVKMQKMGLPDGAVRQRMMRDGVAEAEIANYFGESSAHAQISANSEAEEKAKVKKAKAESEALRTSAEFAKYVRMEKMKLPEGAIRHKMMMEGIDKVKIDIFFGKSLQQSADMEQTKALPKPRLTKLQWNVLPEERLKNSVWADKKTSSDALDVDDMGELTSLFAKPKPVTRKKKPGPKSQQRNGKKKAAGIVESKRAYNVNITLKAKFKGYSDYTQLADALRNMDTEELPLDRLEILRSILPDKTEMSLINRFKNKTDTMNACELFFLAIAQVEGAHQLCTAMIYALEFDVHVENIRNAATCLMTASTSLKESKKLEKILAQILAIGNALNNGQVSGFSLDSLLKLSTTKAADKKTTVMDYLVKVVSKNEELLTFPSELSNLKEAGSLSFAETLRDFKVLKEGLDHYEKIAASGCGEIVDVEGNEDVDNGEEEEAIEDPHAALMAALKRRASKKTKKQIKKKTGKLPVKCQTFVDRARMAKVDLEKTMKAMEKAAKECVEYFGENGAPAITQVCDVLHKFTSAFESAAKKKLEADSRMRRRKAAEKQKSNSSARSSLDTVRRSSKAAVQGPAAVFAEIQARGGIRGLKRDIALKSSGDVVEIEKTRALDDLVTSIVSFHPQLGRDGAKMAKLLAQKLCAKFDSDELAKAREDGRLAMSKLLNAVGFDTRSAAQKRAAEMRGGRK